jgi:hypothetical protein
VLKEFTAESGQAEYWIDDLAGLKTGLPGSHHRDSTSGLTIVADHSQIFQFVFRNVDPAAQFPGLLDDASWWLFAFFDMFRNFVDTTKVGQFGFQDIGFFLIHT